MGKRLLILWLLLSVCAVAFGQATPPSASRPAKPKKAAKPKKVGPRVIILNVVDKTGGDKDQAIYRSLWARAPLLTYFQDHKIDPLFPGAIDSTEEQLHVDFGDPANWTEDNFDKLAGPWSPEYIAAVELNDVNVGTPAGKNQKTLDASVDLSAWLYDVKGHRFLLENDKTHWHYMAHKGDEKLDATNIGYEVIRQGVQQAFKDSLKKKDSKR